MSIRRFNYTERRRIAHGDIAIYLQESEDSCAFDATLDLNAYELPKQARIVIEAYRQTTVRRYAFGTVADTRAQGATGLEDFGDGSGVLFRAKVVDAGTSGRLLAEVDRVHAVGPQTSSHHSFVRVADAALKGEFWRLSFDPGGPLLELEAELPREGLLHSPHFKCFVYPQVLRELLRRALEDWDDDGEEEETWQSKAVAFAKRLCGNDVPKGDDEDLREEWVTAAVTAFCRKHGLMRRYADTIIGADS